MQLMNGQTDVPRELFTADDFSALVSFATTMRFGQVSYWSLNRDRPCPAGVTHPRAVGTCSGVGNGPFRFGAIIGRYAAPG
jgi:hypothetical protein